MAQIKGGLFSKGGGNNGGLGFPVIEITLDQVDNDDINFTEEQFNQIMACGNFTLKFPDGTFYNFIGSNNSQQASAFFYAIQDNQTTTPTELQVLQLSIVKSSYVGTISPNTYTNGGGGSQLYQHNILIHTQLYSSYIAMQVISTSNTQLTEQTLTDYIQNNMTSDGTNYLEATGHIRVNSKNHIVEGIYYSSSAQKLKCVGYNYSTSEMLYQELTPITTITDTVITL